MTDARIEEHLTMKYGPWHYSGEKQKRAQLAVSDARAHHANNSEALRAHVEGSV